MRSPASISPTSSDCFQRVSTLSSSCSDPESISSHIYHPNRLQIVQSCITASGTVDLVRKEADGDLHIRLNLDSGYRNLTNSANDEFQYGDLAVEIICVNPATQAEAIPSCQNYTNYIPIPDVGQHITVFGPYVLDKEHANWAEIHPVYSLLIGASLGTTVNIATENSDIFCPDGATNGWLGPSPRSYAAWHALTEKVRDQFTDTVSLYSTSFLVEQIISIAVSALGVSVVSIFSNPLIIFSGGATVTITLSIETPDSNYDGPIDVQMAAS